MRGQRSMEEKVKAVKSVIELGGKKESWLEKNWREKMRDGTGGQRMASNSARGYGTVGKMKARI